MSDLEIALKLVTLIIDGGMAVFMGLLLLKFIDWQRGRDRDEQEANEAQAKERTNLVDLLREQIQGLGKIAQLLEQQMQQSAEAAAEQTTQMNTLRKAVNETPQKTVDALMADDGKLLAQFQTVRHEVKTLGDDIQQRLKEIEDRMTTLPDKKMVTTETHAIQKSLDKVLSRIDTLEQLARNGHKTQEETHDRPIEQTMGPVGPPAGVGPTIVGNSG